MDILDLRQGDVIRGGRVFYQTGKEFNLIKYRKGYGISKKGSTDKKTQVWAMPATLCDMVVITQSCDIRKLDSLVMAPVFPITYGLIPEKQDQVRRQRVTYLYYLPSYQGSNSLYYPESYVDARLICTAAKNVVSSFEVVRRMNSYYQEQFRFFVFNHYCRPALSDELLSVLSLFIRKATDSKMRDQIDSLWIKQNEFPFPLLVVFKESSPSAVDKLETAINTINYEQSEYQFVVDCRILSGTTLSDVRGYTRMAFDYLSYPLSPGSTSIELSY